MLPLIPGPPFADWIVDAQEATHDWLGICSRKRPRVAAGSMHLLANLVAVVQQQLQREIDNLKRESKGH